MPFNNPRSPVLIESIPPPPLPRSTEPTSPQLPIPSTPLGEITSVGSNVTTNITPHTSTMESSTEAPDRQEPQAMSAPDDSTSQPGTLSSSDNENLETPNADAASTTTHPVIDSSSEEPPAASTETDPAQNLDNLPTDADRDTTDMPPSTPPPEVTPDTDTDDQAPERSDNVPSWVNYEEDTSVPDEEEMKEIEGSEHDKLSALDIAAMEQQFYLDVDDPEQRPVKKIRLSWLIKGVRGTKETPNYARVMNSPGAYVDGLYWSIKFYPRGESCTSLSAFIRCSREPPPVDEEGPECDFSFWEGQPETDFASNPEPNGRITVSARIRPKSELAAVRKDQASNEDIKQSADVLESEGTSSTSDATSQGATDPPTSKSEGEALLNWRLSAQLGMVIYNPAEPRTGSLQSDGHQFSRDCDDWGWVNFVGPWDEIHKRKRGQRQALLRNDVLAIDAYIRIYDDPTEALWWHESKDENQWPSKEITGYFSMGTPSLYHSPAVAGITSLLLLAPVRQILQSADGGKWWVDSTSDPKPLISNIQLVLDQMRNLYSDCYVNLYKVIEELLEVDEWWNDVSSFWEVFRRSLELELSDQPEALAQLSSIFDADGIRWKTPSIPVPASTSTQHGMRLVLSRDGFKGALPNFMPILLNRSEFDDKVREWKLHHNRVRLDDKLNLSEWCTDSDPTFTLYGFCVHVGARNSGKYYCVLRPGGIGTKWLAFEDGNGNKVYSYSTKRICEYEGLDDDDLQKLPSGDMREDAYLAMYIRTSCLASYLPKGLEPYRVPKWLKPWADDPREDDADSHVHQEVVEQSPSETEKQEENGIKIELCLDECAGNCENKLKLHDLRTTPAAREMCRTVTVAADKTFKDLRHAIARAFEVDDHTNILIWKIHYDGLGTFSRAILKPVSYRRKIAKEAIPGRIFRLWISVQQPVGEYASHQCFLDNLNDLNLETKATEEEVVVDWEEVERLATMIDAAAEQQSTPTIQAVSNAEDIDVAGPDAEQLSVQSAVEADIENANSEPSTVGNEDGLTATAPSAPTGQSESSEGEDGLLTPTSSARSVALSPDIGISVGENEAQAEIQSNTTGFEAVDATVHGHLVDAAQHPDVVSDVQFTHTTADVPHGDANALAQVLAEEFPPEVIPAASETPVPDTVLRSGGHSEMQIDRESQDRTPTQSHVARAYGNLQIFDTENQRFLAQRPFHPELEMKIGTAIKQQLKYDNGRAIQVWRRRGVIGTEPVDVNMTFMSAGLADIFTLIVGDVLSESRVDELKAAGHYTLPQQLIVSIGMTQRKNPRAALTSTEPVELGRHGDEYSYYKGAVLRGRPHGEHGFLITSTGHTYSGPFVAGQKSGTNGKMIYQNGDTYIGEWFNDERHGQGEYVEKRTGNRYVGGFENGKRWGQGTTYWQVADQQADMCQICYEEEIDALFYDCGHVCACVVCAKQCDSCPICRKSVRQVVKMYRA